MAPLRRESLKKHQKADVAKWTVPASRAFVFGIRYLRRRVCLTRSGMGRQQLSGAFELELAGWAEDAVIADFGGAPGQDVLKKPMENSMPSRSFLSGCSLGIVFGTCNSYCRTGTSISL